MRGVQNSQGHKQPYFKMEFFCVYGGPVKRVLKSNFGIPYEGGKRGVQYGAIFSEANDPLFQIRVLLHMQNSLAKSTVFLGRM